MLIPQPSGWGRWISSSSPRLPVAPPAQPMGGNGQKNYAIYAPPPAQPIGWSGAGVGVGMMRGT